MPQTPIFVINLDRAHARMERVSARLAGAGLAFERIAAVDAATLSAAAIARLNRKRRIGGELSLGEIACIASHFQAFERFLASGATHGCIMEDDAVFTPELRAWMMEPPRLPDFRAIVKLEGNIRPKTTVLSVGEWLGGTLVFPAQVSFGTACYVITRAAAERALVVAPRLSGPIDSRLFRYWATGIAVYELYPFLVRQEEGESYIREGHLAVAKMRNRRTMWRVLDKRARRTAASARMALYHIGKFGPRGLYRVPAQEVFDAALRSRRP